MYHATKKMTADLGWNDIKLDLRAETLFLTAASARRTELDRGKGPIVQTKDSEQSSCDKKLLLMEEETFESPQGFSLRNKSFMKAMEPNRQPFDTDDHPKDVEKSGNIRQNPSRIWWTWSVSLVKTRSDTRLPSPVRLAGAMIENLGRSSELKLRKS